MMRLIDLLFPPVCAGCGELLPIGTSELCPECRGKWASEMHARCGMCGQFHHRCQCRLRVPDGEGKFPHLPPQGMEQVHLSVYRPGADTVTGRMILRAKEKRLTSHRRIWGSALSARLRPILSKAAPPVLTYVPRLPSKVRLSGTDQARELACAIGESLSLPVVSLLVRTGGSDQKTKNAAQRFASTAGRYRLRKRADERVRGRQVLLCDDVITTGASVMACAELLFRAGAEQVVAVCVARTDKENEEEQDEKENRN